MRVVLFFLGGLPAAYLIVGGQSLSHVEVIIAAGALFLLLLPATESFIVRFTNWANRQIAKAH